MNSIVSFFLVSVLILAGWACHAAGLDFFLGIIMPLLAAAIFIIGVPLRIIRWASSPVPFRITTTCGQQKSLPWIKPDNLESPYNTAGVIGRMILEVLFFRSLFRNTRTDLAEGPGLSYASSKWLWIFAMLFHWSFLIIVIRHLRFFTEPVFILSSLLEGIDGIFQVGIPVLFITDILFITSISYLFIRRILVPRIKYISLASDYFPLLLILAIAVTGVLMRHFYKVDIIAVKKLAMGLVTFSPVIPDGIGAFFYIHLFLVCVLFIYIPASKLMHMAGIFMSPTRNLANTNRIKRHINPWNHPVKVHTYEEWEDEFRDRLKSCGIPLERE